MSFKKKISILVLTIAIIILIGNLAQQFNENNHYEMALVECGSKENIKSYDSIGYECLNDKPANDDES
ncbi:hypothetical protein ACUR5C_00605 [Aliikangiella sp. IMCC44653]